MVAVVVCKATTTIRRWLLPSNYFVIYDSVSWCLGLVGFAYCVGFGCGCLLMAFIHGEDIWGENGSRDGRWPSLLAWAKLA